MSSIYLFYVNVLSINIDKAGGYRHITGMRGIHPIGVVVRKTGLSDHVIRAWERRYEAVIPTRSDGNQRLYSDEDIARLQLLSKAVEQGARIGLIAKMSRAALKEMLGGRRTTTKVGAGTSGDDYQLRIDTALSIIESSLALELQQELGSWLVQYGITPVIESLIPSLMFEIGERWREGRLRIHNEHLATEAVRGFLGKALDGMGTPAGDRVVITATPPGETHDIGALLCALAAAAEGLEVVHLGADVPFPEIIHLSHKISAMVVMISIIFPGKEPRLVDGLRSLREMVPPDTYILIGGRGSAWYAAKTDEPGLECIESIHALRERLKDIQNQTSV